MKKLGKPARSARYLAKGEMQARKSNYGVALDYYQMSLEYASGDEPMTLYYCMAHALANLGRYEEAKEYAQKSLKECERFAGLGEQVQEVKRKVGEVLEYVGFMEKGADKGIS